MSSYHAPDIPLVSKVHHTLTPRNIPMQSSPPSFQFVGEETEA